MRFSRQWRTPWTPDKTQPAVTVIGLRTREREPQSLVVRLHECLFQKTEARTRHAHDGVISVSMHKQFDGWEFPT